MSTIVRSGLRDPRDVESGGPSHLAGNGQGADSKHDLAFRDHGFTANRAGVTQPFNAAQFAKISAQHKRGAHVVPDPDCWRCNSDERGRAFEVAEDRLPRLDTARDPAQGISQPVEVVAIDATDEAKRGAAERDRRLSFRGGVAGPELAGPVEPSISADKQTVELL